MLHRVFDKSSSVPVIKNNNYESPWFWDMKMSGNTVMYWYLKNCVWFIKFHNKFEKLQDILKPYLEFSCKIKNLLNVKDDIK